MVATVIRERGLTFKRLVSFLDVVKSGGVAAAAPNAPARQSEYHRDIKALSQFFGVPLMRQSGKKRIPTSEGEKLAELSNDYLIALADLKSHWQGRPIEIVIGAGDAHLQWLIIPNLSNIAERFAMMTFKLHNFRSLQIREGLKNRSLDFGILREEDVRATDKSLALGHMDYAFFVPRKLLQKFGLGQADLSKVIQHVPVCTLPTDTTLSRHLADSLSAQKLTFKHAVICESLPQAEKALLTGGYGAILPRFLTSHFRHNQQIVSFDHELFRPLDQRPFLVWNPKTEKTRSDIRRVASEIAVMIRSALAEDKNCSRNG